MPISRRGFMQRGLAVGALGVLLREDALQRVEAAVRRSEGQAAERLAADEDFWFAIQQAFTVDRSTINLNNGGVSPSPRVVQDAMRRHLEFSNNAPTRHLWEILDPQVETVRQRLAASFGCKSSEMAITRNASESLQTCIYGIDMKPGDEALTTTLDYPRMINTYKQREMREGVKLVQAVVPVPLQNAGEFVQAFERAITPRTKVMLASHVVFLTGQINPIAELVKLSRERGIPLVVDGAHAFAHLPFQRDDLGCDYYGTSLHKWLTAPHGTGFLYVREEKIPGLWPLMAAPHPDGADIRKFEEIGTHPAANRLAVAEALTIYHAIGPERKAARLRYLRDRWALRLLQDKRVKLHTRLEPEHGCAIATMAIEGVRPADLVKALWERHHIITVAIDHEQVKGVRVSPNVYTTLDEIDLFSAAVEGILANGVGA